MSIENILSTFRFIADAQCVILCVRLLQPHQVDLIETKEGNITGSKEKMLSYRLSLKSDLSSL